MKTILTFLLLFLFSNSYSNFTTPGTGKCWDLDSLVSFSGGIVTLSSGNYLINDTITISASDTIKILTNSTMKFGTGVFIDINGIMIVNPPDSAKITAQDTTLKFLGLKFEDLSDGSVLKKLIMEYGNSLRMLDCNILIDSCIIRYNTLNSSFASSAINFFRSNSTVSNCKIYRNRRAAIGGGANIANSGQIINNLIYENDTENANVPQINWGATSAVPMIIRGNTIIGSPIMSGGISFLPIGSVPQLIIENNIIKKNRYGIAIAGGSSNVYINNNIIDSNNIQGLPNLGGSGINFNGVATQRSTVTRNIIRGNLWGITIQGTAKPNLGNLSNADTTDAGMNEIYNNKNSGATFDLFNNTVDSIKAENNYWGTSNLDSIEAHISHKPDNGALGFVDYLPIRSIKVNISLLMEGMYDPSLNILARKDSVTVYLYEAVSPFQLRDSAKAEIDSITFTGTFSFTNAPSSLYYFVADHFNCINTWSKSGGESLSANGLITNYDFTSSASQAFGNNLVLKGSKYCMYSGDVNKSGIVDLGDLREIDNDAFNLLTGLKLPSDLNGDNFVYLNDLSIGDNNSFNFVAVIKP
ncbi:MAG: right-handed parallel beta-helix repeat-containing protein [Bacteroidota bacterium]|nr:right-handed parallel beta-helix repeat-containing protein [Bacteroidota bacterium]